MQSHTSISCSFQKSIKYCETQYQIVRVGSPALSLDLHAKVSLAMMNKGDSGKEIFLCILSGLSYILSLYSLRTQRKI